MDYLIEEVLQQQSERYSGVSAATPPCSTACAVRFVMPYCAIHQFQGRKPWNILNTLNLFIVPLDNERRWYRYHHLFGDLLRKRMEQKLNVDEIARLHIHASEWYETNGRILEAFSHAAAANHIERAERLMELKEMPIHLPGVPVTILKWLESLPESVLMPSPPFGGNRLLC